MLATVPTWLVGGSRVPGQSLQYTYKDVEYPNWANDKMRIFPLFTSEQAAKEGALESDGNDSNNGPGYFPVPGGRGLTMLHSETNKLSGTRTVAFSIDNKVCVCVCIVTVSCACLQCMHGATRAKPALLTHTQSVATSDQCAAVEEELNAMQVNHRPHTYTTGTRHSTLTRSQGRRA